MTIKSANLALERIDLVQRGPHLIATLDHAQSKNALTDALMLELHQILDAAHDDDSVRTLVLRGANGVFCAGADLKAAVARISDAPSGDSHGDDPAGDPVISMNRAVGELYTKLNHFPKAVIAVVEGAAFGGGFGMACCADVVLVSDKARFALTETLLGLPPAQIAPYVINRIGQSCARRLALTGVIVDAQEAIRIGLADHCYKESQMDSELTGLLDQIARCAPKASAVTKAILQSENFSITQAAEYFASCLRDAEGREGVQAFLEKRPAAWVETIKE